MFYTPFWIFILITAALALITLSFRKFEFIDIEVAVLVAAAAMACDMLFCKQFRLYHYVSEDYAGWYSFWANLAACPSMGLIFIKFAPLKKARAAAYILLWAAGFTLLELFVLKPWGILTTPLWHTLPWSPVGYVMALTLEYAYFSKLKSMHR